MNPKNVKLKGKRKYFFKPNLDVKGYAFNENTGFICLPLSIFITIKKSRTFFLRLSEDAKKSLALDSMLMSDECFNPGTDKSLIYIKQNKSYLHDPFS